MIYVIDDKTTAMGQGARVSPEYRSTGFWKWYRSKPVLDVMDKIPTVNSFRISTAAKELYMKRNQMGKAPFVHLIDRVILLFYKTEL